MKEKSSLPENVQAKSACPCGNGIADVSDGSKAMTNGIYDDVLKVKSGVFERNFEYYFISNAISCPYKLSGPLLVVAEV
jgi:hypothetical protein